MLLRFLERVQNHLIGEMASINFLSINETAIKGKKRIGRNFPLSCEQV